VLQNFKPQKGLGSQRRKIQGHSEDNPQDQEPATLLHSCPADIITIIQQSASRAGQRSRAPHQRLKKETKTGNTIFYIDLAHFKNTG